MAAALGLEINCRFQESDFHFVFIPPFNLDSHHSPNNNNNSKNNSDNHLQFYQNQEVLNVEEVENQVDFNGFHQNDGVLGVQRLHNKYAPNLMENNHSYQHHRRSEHKSTRPSRLGLRAGGGCGQIVEVQGGHIVRSTGLKDRHSKVCTAKGPRDRRVRLSANTAIQFYDVQDRLGYDRPSKAVDWLIKKAKAAIDELAELPAWTPTAGSTPVVNLERNPNSENVNRRRLSQLEEHPDDDIVDNQMGNVQNSSFLPASLDSVKSFFPTCGSATPAGNNGSSGMQFHQNFPQAEMVLTSQNQDLKLSLQSFQDPMPQSVHGNNIYFDGSGWPENGGFVFNSPATQTTPFLQPLFGQPTNNQMLLNYISQRGPLQSSNSPPVRAWVDALPFSGSVAIDPHQTLSFHHPASMPGLYPGMSGGGFSGFHVVPRIQGEEEEHDGLSDKPSSGSSDSRH